MTQSLPATIDRAPVALTEQQLQLVEREWLQLEQVECPVIHRFGPGIYIREVAIPAGTFAIGHYQKCEQMNVMLKGRVTVLRDDGGIDELVAPMMFVGKPGRKIGYVHEDMVWLNIYATTETDIETLEATYLVKSEGYTESQAGRDDIDRLKRAFDVEDYRRLLDELGMTEQQVRAESDDESTMTELPYGAYPIMVSDSPLQGKGLFATAPIAPGAVIAPALIGGLRTIAGRYTNHSVCPNARMQRRDNGDIDLVAMTTISGAAGGMRGEEITIDYRQALALAAKEDE